MKKSNSILLVKTKINWADEMNLGGFALFTENEWARHMNLVIKGLKIPKFDGRLGIGSNQELYFDLTKYKKQIAIERISKAEAKKIEKQFSIKINDGIDRKNWIYSHFGVLTLFSEDCITDELYNTGEKGIKWLRENNYIKD